MKQLVIGNKGQIGSAIQKILECDGCDLKSYDNPQGGHYDILHVTIPYSENFVSIVSNYIMDFTPELVIIHSTVPVGTCAKFYNNEHRDIIVYSPCRGVHPDLEMGIRTFDKFFAGRKAQEAAKIFTEKIDGECTWSDNERATESLEAAKLWDTTQYGLNIILEKEIHKYCEKYDLDFEVVYTMFNKTYNEGYEKLHHPEYKKYILEHRDGKIGGHCVMANLDLLDSRICDIIKELNT